MKKRAVQYAKRRGYDEEVIALLEQELEFWVKGPHSHHYVSGFAHPDMLVFTDAQPFKPQFFQWGLIPHWVHDRAQAQVLRKQILNARVETIFDKPSFRNSAKNKRCLIYVDAFYEHHHFKSKTYPFHISMKDGSPMCFAGIWDEWLDRETGELIYTTALVTTKANSTMARIHNSPKLEEPRMPAILSKEEQDQWLMPYKQESDKQKLLSLIKPLEDDQLNYHTVHRLKGKEAIGDVAEAEERFVYKELTEWV